MEQQQRSQQQLPLETDDICMQSHLLPQMSMGSIEDFSGVCEAVKGEVHGAIAKYRTAQNILDIADSYTSLPNSKILSILKDSVKHAGDGVAETFFSQATHGAIWGGVDCSAARDELAVELLSVSLTKVYVHNCNFNQTTFGTKAQQQWKSLVTGSKGVEMGQALLIEELVRDHGFQKFLNDKSRWCQDLEAILSDRVYIIGTAVKELASETNLPAKMKLFFLKALGSKKFDDVVNSWRECSSDSLVKTAVDFVESENHLEFAVGALEAEPFASDVTSECSKSKTHSSTETTPIYSPTGGVVTTTHTDTTFGGPVRDWLDAPYGPKKFELRTRVQPNNIQRHSHTSGPMSGCGCFLPGTKILLKKGNSRPIENLAENDKIVGAKGQIGSISSEMVEITFEYPTLLFGFNDESPFFLACHPFWTQHGWRAIDPHGAKQENEWLEVGQLTEGDFVRRVTSYDGKHNRVYYEWVEIQFIRSKKFSEGTKVYGVHTREGPRSYHANGYVVFENYPEITIERITDGMNELSFEKQEQVYEHLEALKPSLEKLLGPGAASAVAKLGQNQLLSILNPKDPKQASRVSLKQVIIPDMKLSHSAGAKQSEVQAFPTKLSLVRGDLFLDEEHVPNCHITDENKVSWTRPTADRKWEHGSVQLYPDRQQGHGCISLTSAREGTRSIASSSFNASANTNTYSCYVSRSALSKDTDSVVAWDDFGKLLMGIDCSGDSCKRIGKIQITPTMDGPESLNNHVMFSVDKNFILHVAVNIPTDYYSLLGYTKLTGTFSWDYSSFSGVAIKYDALKPGFEGDHYAWKGTLQKNVKADAMHLTARKAAMESSVHKQTGHILATPLKSTDRPMALASASVAPMALVMAEMANSTLNLEHLFTLAPPDSKSIHDLTFSLLQKCMKYKMNPSDRENILGVVQPSDLPGSLITICNTYPQFFANRFANAYLMNGLAQADHFKDKITQAEKDKLLYYWAGNISGCLAQDRDYSNINDKIARVAYLQSCPELQKYVDSDGPTWAQKLYDRLIQPQVLNGLALSEDIKESTELIQKQAMVLYCLDPVHDHGKKFYKKIMMSRLNENSAFFKGSTNSKDEEEMKEFIGDYIHQLIIHILSGSGAIPTEISNQLHTELTAAAKELNIELTDNAINSANEIFSGIDSFIAETITLFNQKKGAFMDKFTASMNGFMTKHRILTFVGKFLSSAVCMAAWGFSLIYTIKTFMKWKILTPEQKVSLITDTIAFTFTSIAKIPDFFDSCIASCKAGKTGFKLAKGWIKARNNPEVIDGEEEAIEMSVKKKYGSMADVDQNMAEAAAMDAGDAVETLSNWQKFFAVTEAIARVTSVLALAAAAVAMGFQISRDFKTDAPVTQKALDIVQEVCIGVALIAATAGLFIESMVIPVIGIICALVGIVLAIVDIFMHRDNNPEPKPTPADIYVNGTGKQFVDGLTPPPKKWLDNYKKDHAQDPTK